MQRRGTISALGAILLALVLFVGVHTPARAQDNLENAVKATFLYRFGSFAEWPDAAFAAADAPFVICLSGDLALARLVEQSAATERVGGRPILVRSIDASEGAGGCHILYLAGNAATVRAALNAAPGNVLTVTDSRHAPVRGAIHFVIDNGRVRFHIDRGAAERHGVRLNARLLNIALSVRGGGA